MADEPPKTDGGPAPPERSQITNFIGAINAPNSILASLLQRAEGGSGSGMQATGPLGNAFVEARVAGFLAPGCFDGALRRLRSERVLVLEGKRGLGKFTGAICLLDAVGAEQLEVLAPVLTLKELAECGFEDCHGYLVADYRGDVAGPDSEFNWLRILEQIRKAEVWLVVTINHDNAAPRRSETVQRILWQAPDRIEYLRRRLDGDMLAEVAPQLPDYAPMADLAELATYDDARAALERLKVSSVQPVTEWFAGKPPRDDIVDITALCFLEGLSQPAFERLRDALAAHLEREWPPATGDQPGQAETGLAQSRVRQIVEAELACSERPGGSGRAVLTFSSPAYPAAVLKELKDRYPNRLWDALSAWLEEVVDAGPEGIRAGVAVGLCHLARIEPDSVEEEYLEPWSTAGLDWPKLEAASYLLWQMCCDEELAPTALGIAKRWATSTDLNQRTTAAIVFCGVLGLTYPHEAARMLWHITQNGTAMEDEGILSLATLFALQVSRGEKVRPVLDLINKKLDKYFGRGGGKPFLRLQRLAMDSVLAILGIREANSDRMSVVLLLTARPAASRRIAKFWARTLQDRRYRMSAMIALAEVLAGLRDEGGDAVFTAQRLLTDLEQALPATERDLFRRDFSSYVRRRDSLGEGTLGDILSTALNRENAEGERPG
ncbi:hypothetical protein GCM10017673_48500 [Streptosporangium violaceochromogenes]|nr:hypothetical protein GCM10017673_48500 [Streptosporangium violaceochromogenes]